MSKTQKMIDPFVERQDGKGKISFPGCLPSGYEHAGGRRV